MKITEVSVEVAPTSSYKGYCVTVKVGRQKYPLVYLKKPKPISEASFKAAVEGIEVTLPDGFEFELQKVEAKAPVKVTKK